MNYMIEIFDDGLQKNLEGFEKNSDMKIIRILVVLISKFLNLLMSDYFKRMLDNGIFPNR